MGRIVKNWTPDKVAESAVAPHVYTHDRDEPDHTTYAEWKAAVGYEAGQVVWVERFVTGGKIAVRARIVNVCVERDRWGDRRAKFQVQYETKAGLWSKAWEYTWPGMVQRGYRIALGLDEQDRPLAPAPAQAAKPKA
jgi:hypothetical protein